MKQINNEYFILEPSDLLEALPAPDSNNLYIVCKQDLHDHIAQNHPAFWEKTSYQDMHNALKSFKDSLSKTAKKNASYQIVFLNKQLAFKLEAIKNTHTNENFHCAFIISFEKKDKTVPECNKTLWDKNAIQLFTSAFICTMHPPEILNEPPLVKEPSPLKSASSEAMDQASKDHELRESLPLTLRMKTAIKTSFRSFKNAFEANVLAQLVESYGVQDVLMFKLNSKSTLLYEHFLNNHELCIDFLQWIISHENITQSWAQAYIEKLIDAAILHKEEHFLRWCFKRKEQRHLLHQYLNTCKEEQLCALFNFIPTLSADTIDHENTRKKWLNRLEKIIQTRRPLVNEKTWLSIMIEKKLLTPQALPLLTQDKRIQDFFVKIPKNTYPDLKRSWILYDEFAKYHGYQNDIIMLLIEERLKLQQLITAENLDWLFQEKELSFFKKWADKKVLVEMNNSEELFPDLKRIEMYSQDIISNAIQNLLNQFDRNTLLHFITSKKRVFIIDNLFFISDFLFLSITDTKLKSEINPLDIILKDDEKSAIFFDILANLPQDIKIHIISTVTSHPETLFSLPVTNSSHKIFKWLIQEGLDVSQIKHNELRDIINQLILHHNHAWLKYIQQSLAQDPFIYYRKLTASEPSCLPLTGDSHLIQSSYGAYQGHGDWNPFSHIKFRTAQSEQFLLELLKIKPDLDTALKLIKKHPELLIQSLDEANQLMPFHVGAHRANRLFCILLICMNLPLLPYNGYTPLRIALRTQFFIVKLFMAQEILHEEPYEEWILEDLEVNSPDNLDSRITWLLAFDFNVPKENFNPTSQKYLNMRNTINQLIGSYTPGCLNPILDEIINSSNHFTDIAYRNFVFMLILRTMNCFPSVYLSTEEMQKIAPFLSIGAPHDERHLFMHSFFLAAKSKSQALLDLFFIHGSSENIEGFLTLTSFVHEVPVLTAIRTGNVHFLKKLIASIQSLDHHLLDSLLNLKWFDFNIFEYTVCFSQDPAHILTILHETYEQLSPLEPLLEACLLRLQLPYKESKETHHKHIWECATFMIKNYSISADKLIAMAEKIAPSAKNSFARILTAYTRALALSSKLLQWMPKQQVLQENSEHTPTTASILK